ncbi:hypothetical protein BJ742DRAFT_769521 [Cladochytrium replicatum]|nr:hypothetical protein BJ742DRAFT_769521 [Cladochytrium replicatum]
MSVTPVKERSTGGVLINEIDFGVDDSLDDGNFETVDLFVEVLAQQLDSMLPYLRHNPHRLDDKVIQKIPLIYSITDIVTGTQQLIGLYMRNKKQHPEDEDLPTIKDMDSAELYEPWVNGAFHTSALTDAHAWDSATGRIITDGFYFNSS